MKKKTGFLFFALFVILILPLCMQVKAAVLKEPPTSAEPDFKLYARSAVLMDADSGRVLYEKDGSVHMPNASTTKIMTCILAIESGRLDEAVTASAYAAS